MMELFKEQLTYHDITYGIPYKRLLELRSARERALIEERKELERQREESERAQRRQAIMRR